MSAQVTEKHIDLVRCVLDAEWWGSNVEKKFAQLIADSEAKACAELRADRDYNHECINRLASATGTLGEKSGRVVEVALSTIARAERAEAELAAERARLDCIDSLSPGDAWGIYRSSAQQNANLHAGDPRTLRKLPGIRAAIDAAMKEETK